MPDRSVVFTQSPIGRLSRSIQLDPPTSEQPESRDHNQADPTRPTPMEHFHSGDRCKRQHYRDPWYPLSLPLCRGHLQARRTLQNDPDLQILPPVLTGVHLPCSDSNFETPLADRDSIAPGSHAPRGAWRTNCGGCCCFQRELSRRVAFSQFSVCLCVFCIVIINL